ncbi:hypothetical protein EST38_g1735 [Candolleomyces aberdarensis]|uniref:Alpha-ketoglutarate-dependent dioxygenase AlkB-like domain-containing protein n=1 Tax=Candolleomyces aberdarensis TaxID=2316362 RepID=A0A4Q2DXV3_9AGAR|nr:hypothetical protein EST38_g1735 [Candolleomyces aberdarensis]
MSTTTTAELLDPNSAAYKRARRQFYKTTKNRPTVDQDWTPFRAAEKRFKARFPPPDLSNVLDIAQLDESRQQELAQGVWQGSASPFEYRRLSGSSDACIIPAIPGLVILPSFLQPAQQRELVRWSLGKQAREPNPTNLDTHYHLPEDGLWNSYIHHKSVGEELTVQPKAIDSDVVEPPSSGPRQLIDNTPLSPENYRDLASTPKPLPAPSASVQPTPLSALLYKLRWANIGWYYHWGTKQYDFSRGKGEIDPQVRNICKSAVEAVDWNQVYDGTEDVEWDQSDPEWKSWRETYEPDAGIVNFYQTKDTLMAHVDRSEVCSTSPLVSISRDAESKTIQFYAKFSHAPARSPNQLYRPSDNALDDKMENDAGILVDLYVPRKCSATNRLITSKDHASVQIVIADVDANGRALGTSTTFALCGQVRSQGESDDSLNRLATRAGLLRNVWSYQK